MNFFANCGIGLVATFVGLLICYLTGLALSGIDSRSKYGCRPSGPDNILFGLFMWAVAACVIAFIYCIGMTVHLLIL